MKKKTLMLLVGMTSFFWMSGAHAQTQNQTQTTTQQQTRTQTRERQHAIRDANGDGACDLCGKPVGSGKANSQGKAAKKGKHWGPGDGTGNQGVGPQDGTGYGAQSGRRSGAQDGAGMTTGPQHRSNPGAGTAGGQGGRGRK